MSEELHVENAGGESKPIIAFCDGGYSPSFRRGVWCYMVGKPVFGIIEDKNSKLTCNAMEYHAVIRLLNSLPDGTTVSVHSDSKLIVNQLTKRWNINYEHLRSLADEVWRIVDSKKLRVSFSWLSRWDNPAGRFIEDNEKMIYCGGKPENEGDDD